jgi:hypothetical protein
MRATLLFKCLTVLFKKQGGLSQQIQNQGMRQSQCKIIVQEFDENSDETRFKIHRQGSNRLITLTAKHFALNKKLLQQLTHEDAYLIGFTFASELAAREKECMLALKLNADCRV